MNTCEFKSACTFYIDLQKRSPAILASISEEYCEGSYNECARFMVSMAHGPRIVSKYLFPEDTHEACKILDELG
jgi:hypothetical protein